LPSPGGGSAFALVTQSEDYGQYVMHVWRVNLSADGLSAHNDPYSLLRSPLTVDQDFICTCREDAPELVAMFGPGLNVVRINADASSPQDALDRFNVPGSELSHFYDGFVSQGNVYFLSASPDGHLDYSRVHILPLNSRGPLITQYCQQDPQRGFPPARKQAGLDAIAGFILLAGGEIDYGNGNVTRLVDYWVLDLTSFKWNQIPAQMPVPLIEPRLTTANSGSVYAWGDFDEPLPGMPPTGTHVRILRIRGFNAFSPPPYNAAMGAGGYGGGGQNPQPYPPAGGQPPYPQQQQGGYGNPAPQQGGGYGGAYPPPNQQGGMNYDPGMGYGQGQGQAPPGYGQGQGGQQGGYPYYPPGEKKKDCVIS